MNLAKFSLYQCLCSVLVACLKPFTIVVETLLHYDVGERYADMAGLVALFLLGVDAEFTTANQSTLIWLLMAVFAVRIVMLRVAGIRRRRRGDYSIHSRSAGTSILRRLSGRLPPQAIPWIEPVVVMLAALIVWLLNSAVGDFLLWSGAALLCINLVRLSADYNKELDFADARLEEDAQANESVAVFPPGISTPARVIDLRVIPPGLLSVAESSDVEIEPELSSLLPVGGGVPWK